MNNDNWHLAGFTDKRAGGTQEKLLKLAFPLTRHDHDDRRDLKGFLANAVANAV